jgi:hypothetical protein
MVGPDDSRNQPSPRDQAHTATRAALPQYAAAVALGQNVKRRFPRETEHLDSCQECRANLDELLGLVLPAYRGQLPPVAERPHVDLSFLRPAVRPSWAIETAGQLRRLLVEFSEPLLAQLNQARLAQATRGPVLYHYTPEPPPGELGLTIDVFADEQAPGQGSVQVLLDLPGLDPLEQAGTHVTLRIAELVWEGSTGATGAVTFAAVPLTRLAQLRLEVALPENCRL